MIQRISPPALFDDSSFGMSQGSVDPSGLIFLSGQVAWDEKARVVGSTYAEQARKALDNLQLALDAAGSDMNHLLHVRVYLRGELADHLEELAPIFYERWGAARPGLTGIGVASLATPDTLIEIEVVARVREGSGSRRATA
jgi:enamine deaminase RidA (YjgF/YER057c/UK114 family)